MAAALELARRAVAETDRSEPEILDTLAELHFLLGDRDRALATIDEAIGRRPEDPYYREQRRRFNGERPRDDRPQYPFPGSGGPSKPESPERERSEPEGPGLTA
jgi:hypothetical protein